MRAKEIVGPGATELLLDDGGGDGGGGSENDDDFDDENTSLSGIHTSSPKVFHIDDDVKDSDWLSYTIDESSRNLPSPVAANERRPCVSDDDERGTSTNKKTNLSSKAMALCFTRR